MATTACFAWLLLDPDDAFQQALDTAQALLCKRLEMEHRLPNSRLVWDLSPRPPSKAHPEAEVHLLNVAGDSAGAAFAAAALALIAKRLPNDMQQWLRVIEWPRAAVTAALADDQGELKAVAGIEDKAHALMAQDCGRRSERVANWPV